jgi:alginate O-acetyltransferase complex protein AlgI
MLFQSLGFLIFFTFYFFLYWALSSKTNIRNGLLLSASMYLYYLWDVRFLLILLTLIIINFLLAKFISKDSRKGKFIFYFAVLLNILPLLFFKYYNFFLENFNDFSTILGLSINLQTIKLLLPVGISFYTFLSLSYLIDVYKKYIQHESNLVNYALSISYFPIIMSGPIHRPRVFLKQLREKRKFDYNLAVEGLRQVMTGLFLKIVVADSIAEHADKVFNEYYTIDGFSLLIGSIYFSFQLYFDFNGYSEMAIGISKLLGFRIDRNFRYPYLSRTIADFWKRWHISLTEWFRDYIFLPLSYIVSRNIKQNSVFNKDLFIYSVGIFITWSLTGFWHGAGWTFIIWGMIHAILLIINKGFFKKKKKLLKKLGLKKDNLIVIVYETIFTFILVNLAWIFFRSETAGKGFYIAGKIFSVSDWCKPVVTMTPLILISFVLILEFFQRDKEFLFEISNLKSVYRWGIYITATFLIIYYSGNASSFIYFGF